MSDSSAPESKSADSTPPPGHRPFTSYAEGDRFKGDTFIEYMIYDDEKFIVFLDQDGFVWYEWNPEFEEQTKKINDFDRIRNRVGVLESIDVSHLSHDQLLSFKRLVGDALVCVLREGNAATADENLNQAQQYISARNQEAARFWYVMSGFWGTVGVLLAWIAIAVWLRNRLDDGLVDCLFGACAGGLGAFLSILTRLGKANLDVSAGMKLHILEGLSRIGVGVLGGVVVTIAYALGLLFSTLQPGSASRDLLIVFISIVAGISERLVPTLIKSVEIGAVKNGEKEQAPAKPPLKQNSNNSVSNKEKGQPPLTK
ncbi:MAG: hypothetical protein L0215_02715 [Gemmataceae bacterium]|nr:hypothetical protein [Gemmataceae bacterium]